MNIILLIARILIQIAQIVALGTVLLLTLNNNRNQEDE